MKLIRLMQACTPAECGGRGLLGALFAERLLQPTVPLYWRPLTPASCAAAHSAAQQCGLAGPSADNRTASEAGWLIAHKVCAQDKQDRRDVLLEISSSC